MAHLVINSRSRGVFPTRINYATDEKLAQFVLFVHEQFKAGEGIWVGLKRSEDPEDPDETGGISLIWMPPEEGFVVEFDGDVPALVSEVIPRVDEGT